MSQSTQRPAKKRRGPPVCDPGSSDEALKIRRQKNREAQHIFRKRRQAASVAQNLRIKALEDVVEDMTSVFVSLFDEILGTEELAKQHPGLVDSLRSSAARILASVKAVTNANGEYLTPETASIKKRAAQHEQDASANGSFEDSSDFITSHVPFIFNPHKITGNSYIEMPSPVNPGVNVDLGTTATTTSTLYPISSQAQQILSALDSFSFRLIETTLSRAYHFLNGTLDVPAHEFQRAFGSSLRFRTHVQLLTQVRWLLGPGRSYMRQAAGLPWSAGQRSRLSYLESKTSPSPPQIGLPLSGTYHLAPPGFLTAIGIQEQLRGLGGRMVDPDTMEIILDNSAASAAEAFNFDDPSLSGKTTADNSTPLAMRLSVSLLTANLAHTAVCLNYIASLPNISSLHKNETTGTPAELVGAWTTEQMEPKFAYAQYVTNMNYLCNAVINFGRLRSFGVKHDLVLIHPTEWVQGPHQIPLLCPDGMDSRASFRLRHPGDEQHGSLLSQPVGSCSGAPRITDIAKQVLGSHVMLIEPNEARHKKIMDEALQSGEFDMEVLNYMFRDSAMILPHRRLALLTGEFRTQDHEKYLALDVDEEWNAMGEVSRAYLVHFSDWPLPKPWKRRTKKQWEDALPECRDDDVEREDRPRCSDRVTWMDFYETYDREKKARCNGLYD
ncbi:hypothetical protein AK830_g3769 [Neonectria ditissima]|uniref:BZIP domain-containing protein n=1 Tax=Neonectria ditissima TaxID=78410 RepID=A0A0P7BN56_9HYPO|nr:hypothetical protein AK830_g3769 [Neonectria ditissima]